MAKSRPRKSYKQERKLKAKNARVLKQFNTFQTSIQSRSSAGSQYRFVLSQDGSYSGEAFNLMQKAILDLSDNANPCRDYIVNFGPPDVSACETVNSWAIEQSRSAVNIDLQNCQAPDGEYYRDYELESCIDESLSKAKTNVGIFYQAYNAGYADARANDLAAAAYLGFGVALMLGLYAYHRHKKIAHTRDVQPFSQHTAQAIQRPRAETEVIRRYRALSIVEEPDQNP